MQVFYTEVCKAFLSFDTTDCLVYDMLFKGGMGKKQKEEPAEEEEEEAEEEH